MRRDMPDGLVAAIGAAAGHGRARPRGPSGGPPPPLGPGPPARRRGGTLDGGRVPDDASCDVLARRVAAGERDGGGVDLTAYDRLVGEEARLRVV